MSLLNDLIAYWKLDEASGTRADAHGSNDLADNNTVGSDTGKISASAQFVRANSEYLSIAENADLTVSNIDYTLAGWVYLDSKPATAVIISKLDSSHGEYFLWYDGGSDRFIWRVYGSAGYTGAGSATANNFGSPSTGTWYHIVVWHDSTNNEIGISVNGGTPDTIAHAGGTYDGDGPVWLGGYIFEDYFDGRLDEWGFWKRVLTSQERTDLYNGGAGLAYAFGGAAEPIEINAQFHSRTAFEGTPVLRRNVGTNLFSQSQFNINVDRFLYAQSIFSSESRFGASAGLRKNLGAEFAGASSMLVKLAADPASFNKTITLIRYLNKINQPSSYISKNLKHNRKIQ